MVKFVGIKDNRISVLSDKPFESTDILIMELPKELQKISPEELIINYKLKNNQFCKIKENKPANQLKVAFVSNYGTKCGIGTYSKFLFDELINHLGDYRVFIEEQENYDFDSYKLSKDKIIPCWIRGKNLSKLINEINDFGPDIVFIQHEWGLFPDAKHWLSLLTQLRESRVIVTMHSVYPNHKDKLICEAAIPEIIVHLEGAKKNLKEEKGVYGKVSVIPHGCYPFNEERLWNLYKSPHTFMQAGFGFRYKNFESSIKAAAILKDKYPDIFFTALFSESEYSKIDHQIYYNDLISLANKLGISSNVAIIRGYQSDAIMDSYLRTNKIAVFPYISNPHHEVFGSSGAARLAMSANMPVISSNMNHFVDLPTLKADSPEEIAKCLDLLFSNSKAFNEQLEKQKQFVIEHSWKNIAIKHIELFENCI